VGKQTFSLVATVTNRICAFGFVLNPMSISIVKHSVDKVIVWCVLGRNGTIGSYLFEDAIGRPVTVSTDR